MINITKLKSTIFVSFLTCLTVSIDAMQAPKPRLSRSDFNAAAVLPYTRWKSKSEGGNAYFLLSREKNGRDAGTYDTFGGKRDAGEHHPEKTAGREFSEESLNILGDAASAIRYINVNNNHTKYIIHRASKKYVTYITKYSTTDLEKLAKDFYTKLRDQHTRTRSEKDSLRWVKWMDLEKAIAASTPGNSVCVKGAKVDTRTGRLLKHNGKPVTEDITLRPILPSILRPLFQGQPYIEGKNPKIRFYN